MKELNENQKQKITGGFDVEILDSTSISVTRNDVDPNVGLGSFNGFEVHRLPAQLVLEY